MAGDLAGLRVTVMGLGRFGGGLGVTRWLVAQDADVIVTDLLSADALEDGIDALRDLLDAGQVTLRLGTHNVSDFARADLVVANPAVPKPWSNRFLRSALAAGVPITTEIRQTVDAIDRGRVIGVTGTAGKSTTSAMIHHILTRAGHRSHLGGNLGGSLLPTLDAIAPDDWIVLELSSFMLHWLGPGVGTPDAAGWSPHIAILTNLAPNHLDWHGDVEHYRSSKEVIFNHQQSGDHQITAADVTALPETFSLPLPGDHNRQNAAFAVAAVGAAIGLAPDSAATHLADFRGLPHRLELVTDHDGRRFFNDSKSTTPEATVRAVHALAPLSSVHLIAGGYDKAVDLTAIAELAKALGGLYTIGATGPAIASAASGPVHDCGTLDAAVAAAHPRLDSGSSLLLSPGCASWDQFSNYEERGERFIQLVKQHLTRAPQPPTHASR